jgi:hypothetical protein
MTPDDHFRLSSQTKTYTATVILRLVASGRLDLSDPVERRLPGVLPPDQEQITVQQLLAHSSGLYDSFNEAPRAYLADPAAFLSTIEDPRLRDRIVALGERLAADPEAVFEPRIWVDIAAAVPLYFPPGTDVHYSNTNYLLLGSIIEAVTATPLVPEQLGIATYQGGCGTAYGHDGAFAGYTSYARVSADAGTVAVLLLNGRARNTDARGRSVIARLFCDTVTGRGGGEDDR